jgi:hypothetical protein
MRRALALGVAAVLCMAVVALAGDDKMGDKGHMGKGMMAGNITKVDMAGKMMMVKDADGKESAVYWNDTTKVEGGDLKEGSKVHYKGETKDGKMWASWVHVGEMKKM